MNEYITLFKGPAKDAGWAMDSLKYIDKTIQEASNNKAIVGLVKAKFNYLELYSVIEYEVDDSAQDILDSLEDKAWKETNIYFIFQVWNY